MVHRSRSYGVFPNSPKLHSMTTSSVRKSSNYFSNMVQSKPYVKYMHWNHSKGVLLLKWLSYVQALLIFAMKAFSMSALSLPMPFLKPLFVFTYFIALSKEYECKKNPNRICFGIDGWIKLPQKSHLKVTIDCVYTVLCARLNIRRIFQKWCRNFRPRNIHKETGYETSPLCNHAVAGALG